MITRFSKQIQETFCTWDVNRARKTCEEVRRLNLQGYTSRVRRAEMWLYPENLNEFCVRMDNFL